MWKVNYSKEILKLINSLDNRSKEKLLSRLYLLRRFGPELGRPYADTVKGSLYTNLKELRIRSIRGEIRIFYLIGKNRQIVLLVGGIKTNGKGFYRKMIKKAEGIYCEYIGIKEKGHEDI